MNRQQVPFLCDIIGPQEREGDRVALEQLCCDSGLSQRVVLWGELDNRSVRRRLRESDILVLPAYSEGLPLAILEAMSLGLPVVATDVGGISEAVRQPEVPTLKPGGVAGLARALGQLIDDPALRGRCSAVNRRQMATTLRSDDLGARFVEMWMEVAGL